MDRRGAARAGAGRCDDRGDTRHGASRLDVLADGEIRCESYSNRFATALDGLDIDTPGTAGPFRMAQQTQDEYYGDDAALALDFAAVVNEELRDAVDAGAGIVQIDEPYLQARPERARDTRS